MKPLDPSLPAVERGILTVGIGKKSSQHLPPELAREILADLNSSKANPLSKGAFMAALLHKGLTEDEKILGAAFPLGALADPVSMIEHLSPTAPPVAREACVKLLRGGTLSADEAERLGDEFLFADAPGDELRGFVASFLRVRYETDDEYEGLLKSMTKTMEAPFHASVPPGDPVVQLAEPFDGLERSFFVTPLIARHLQGKGYRAVSLMGRSSGPKFGLNLLDLWKALEAPIANGNQALAQPKPAFGWGIRQADLSKRLDQWVERRWKTRKRPFLSTLEKFMNPAKASLFITSAFHPPYTEKMVTAAERAGFPAIVVLRRGLEGTLTVTFTHPVEALVSVLTPGGTYRRTPLNLRAEELLGAEKGVDKNVREPAPEENAALIRSYAERGTSGDIQFDRQVRATLAVIDRCLMLLSEA